MKDPKDVVRAFVAAHNRHDIEELLSHPVTVGWLGISGTEVGEPESTKGPKPV